jgi:SRSO17 transposase
LDAFAGCFTKPTFIVFTAMVVGMIAQTASKTVCGMLAGAGLAQTWSHDRVHRFFAAAVWSIDAVGLIVLDLVVTHLMDTDAVIVLAVDDTAHRRRGKMVFILSFRVSRGCDLRRPVVDSVVDGTLAA